MIALVSNRTLLVNALLEAALKRDTCPSTLANWPAAWLRDDFGFNKSELSEPIVAEAEAAFWSTSKERRSSRRGPNVHNVTFNKPEPIPAKPTVTVTKPAPVAEDKSERVKVFGYSATSVLRWMGANGWDADEAGVAMLTLGAGSISDVTIRLQLKAGAEGKRGPAAPLSRAQAKALKDAAE